MMELVAVVDINIGGKIVKAGDDFVCDKTTGRRLLKNGDAKKKRKTRRTV